MQQRMKLELGNEEMKKLQYIRINIQQKNGIVRLNQKSYIERVNVSEKKYIGEEVRERRDNTMQFTEYFI